MGMFWRKVNEEQPEAIVSSAARLSMQGLRLNRQLSDSEWQREAWLFYDSVPEFRFVCDWKSQAASRIRLFITTVDPDGTPGDNPTADVPFAATFLGGPVAQAQLLAAMVLHLEVVGQCFLVGQWVDGGEQWNVYAIDDLIDNGNGTFLVDDGLGEQQLLAPESTVIIKVWRSHPRRKAEPNAPARAARAPLREIIRADQTIAAQMDSRLAGNGLLLLPKELSYTVAGADADGPSTQSGTDQFMADLTTAMMTAISDPNSVEAVVPILVQGPGDELEKARLLALSTPVSEGVSQARDTAVGRLARGLDIAAEVLLGLGDTNHLSGYQIEESNAKVHLANPVELICAALTEQYLWPSIRGAMPQDYRRYIVWYSLSELVQRPDRAADAQQVYDRGELSGQSLRRENGFTESDAPDPQERRRHDLLEVAGKVPVAAPAVVAELLKTMGVDVSLEPSAAPANPNAAPAIAAQPAGPGGVGHTISRSAPQQSRPLPAVNTAESTPRNASITAAAEALCLRALETAGKRLAGRDRYKFEHQNLRPSEYHTAPGMTCTPASARKLLRDTLSTCPSVASAAAVDGERLTACLREYCTELLCSGTPHETSKLTKLLESVELT